MKITRELIERVRGQIDLDDEEMGATNWSGGSFRRNDVAALLALADRIRDPDEATVERVAHIIHVGRAIREGAHDAARKAIAALLEDA